MLYTPIQTSSVHHPVFTRHQVLQFRKQDILLYSIPTMSQDQKPSSYSYSGSHFPTATVLYSHITEQVRGHGNNPNPVHDNNFIVTYSDVGPSWGKDAGFALERQECL